MRKYRQKIISISLTAALLTALFTGCGSAAGGQETLVTVDPAKYVTLGEYKGLTVEREDTSVSDGDIEEQIQADTVGMGDEKEVTDRPAEMGDTVNIDYEGKKDGVAFDGGTGNYDLELGSETFIPGFEEGVVGMKVGDEKDLELTFPEDYHSEDLAGADVVFHVKLNKITEVEDAELNDEFVKGLGIDVSTVDEYMDYIRNDLEEQKKADAEDNLRMDLLQQAVDNATCDEAALPAWLVSQNEAAYKESTESFWGQFGMTLDDYLEQMGIDRETFDQEAADYGREEAKSDLVVAAIAKAEGIKVSDKDIQDSYAEYAEEYDTTVDEIKKEIPEDELKTYLIRERVIDFLYDYANITESKE